MSEFIGLKVAIPGTRGHGFIRYYGPIQGKNGVFGGVELVGPIASSRGKNSGAVEGIQYFEVEHPMTGLFLPFERLMQANPQLLQLQRSNSTSSSNSSNGSSSGSVAQTSKDDLKSSSPMVKGTSSHISKSQSTNDIRSITPISRRASTQSLSQKQPLAPSKAMNQVSSLPKQRTSILGKPASRRSISASGNTMGHSRVSDHSALERELQEMKEKYTRDMAEKMAILNELQGVVQEVQPLISKYELDLNDKDKKIAKQKQDFEIQKEEWKKTFDLMALERQEYDEQLLQRDQLLEEKEAEIKALNSTTTKDIPATDVQQDSSEELTKLQERNSELQLKLSNLEMKNDELMVKFGDLKGNYTALKAKHVDLQASHTSQEEGLSKGLNVDLLEERNRDLESKLNEYEEKIQSLTKTNEELLQELIETKQMLVSKDEEISRLEDTSLAADVSTMSIQNESNLKEQLEIALRQKSELEQSVEQLNHELAIRPTFDELVELQNSLEEIDDLHKNELTNKDEEIERLLNLSSTLQVKVDNATTSAREALNSSTLAARPEFLNVDKDSPESAISYPSPSIDLGGADYSPSLPSLPVYSPQVKVDPSSGKSDWCGLCERDGHSSIECPYENDIF
ncbi:uncharacterized protein RJT20DRAFT_125169 [Scheffersomyces xylosifermentans]|uniref:uncharacterized protein n=1 Tax=Scheffersomyces xylosifermentans TaxID=1304137 RepID=UPI00315D10BA